MANGIILTQDQCGAEKFCPTPTCADGVEECGLSFCEEATAEEASAETDTSDGAQS